MNPFRLVRQLGIVLSMAVVFGCGKEKPVASVTPEPVTPIVTPQPSPIITPPTSASKPILLTPPVPEPVAKTLPEPAPQPRLDPPGPTPGVFQTAKVVPPPTPNPTNPIPAPKPDPEPVPPPPGTTTPPPSGTTTPPEPPADAPKIRTWPRDVEGKNLSEWLKETQNTDPAVREAAVLILPLFGPDARKPSVKDVARLAMDADPGVRIAAFTTIGSMGYEGVDQKAVFDQMRLAMNNSTSGSASRYYALQAIVTYGQDAATMISAIDQMKGDAWWKTRQSVATAMGRLGAPQFDDPPQKDPLGRPIPKKPASEMAMKALRTMVENDKSAAVRLEAVYSLISIGPPYSTNPADYVKTIAPSLEFAVNQFKKEKDKSVQIWLLVLQMMYDDRSFTETMPKVAGYLQTADFVVRSQALNALVVLGPRAIPVLPQVRDCLKLYDEPILLAAAIGCITAMGKDAAGVIPDLEKFRDETKIRDLKTLASDAIDALSGKKKVGETMPVKKDEVPKTPEPKVGDTVPPKAGEVAPPKPGEPAPIKP